MDRQLLPPITDSTFHMLRCVIVVAHADRVVEHQERQFVETMIDYFQQQMLIPPVLKERLLADIQSPQPIGQLLPRVTDRTDREHLVLFAGMLARADGEVAAEEEAILRRFRAHAAAGARQDVTIIPPDNENIDINRFYDEVREIVRQEFYTQAIAGSGLHGKSSALSVADAFAQQGTLVKASPYARMKEGTTLSLSTRRTLLPDEQVLRRAHFPRIYLLETAIIAAFLWWAIRVLVPLTYDMLYDLQQSARSAGLETLLAGRGWHFSAVWLGRIIAALFILYRILHQWTTEIVLTDKRILFKRGIFFVRFVKIDLRQLFEMEVQQSRLGAICNYGRVHIFTTMVSQGIGGAQDARSLQFPAIADPHGFCASIDRARRMLYV